MPPKRSAASAGDGGGAGLDPVPAKKAKSPPSESTGLWLMKNEPEDFGFEMLQCKPNQRHYWDAVRNHEAKNNLKRMQVGDSAFFYHSMCKVPGIAGVMKIVLEAYPDFEAGDPKNKHYDAKYAGKTPPWVMVDVGEPTKLGRFLSLTELKTHSGPGGALEGQALFTRNRLSVQPVSKGHWDFIVSLASKPAP